MPSRFLERARLEQTTLETGRTKMRVELLPKQARATAKISPASHELDLEDDNHQHRHVDIQAADHQTKLARAWKKILARNAQQKFSTSPDGRSMCHPNQTKLLEDS